MGDLKRLSVTVIGFAAASFGAWLRLSAKELAWPTRFSYSGPREGTEWAIKEHAYQDIGLVALVFGLALLLVALAHWLWARPHADESNVRKPAFYEPADVKPPD